MGANAQTTVPTFTAGQVLTADQQNNSARTGVPVFATTVTRDAGFGGAGEKTLAEGQLCYLEDANVVQYYDGAAWATVGPASAGGLVLLSSTTFTTATSVSLPANTFTATYRNYRLQIDLTALTAGATLTGRLRASGTDNSTNNYRAALNQILNSVASVNSTAGTSFNFGQSASGGAKYKYTGDIMTPQLATQTALTMQLMGRDTTDSDDLMLHGVQHFNATTQFDSFTFISSVASSMSGVITVYGYAVA